MIALDVKPPKGDFFLHRQQIYLYPKKYVTLPKDFALLKQIENLAKKRFIKILYDSEAREELANV